VAPRTIRCRTILRAVALTVPLGFTGPPGVTAVGGATTLVGTAAPRAAPLRPNLIVLRANDLHVVRDRTGRMLRFESALGNIGDGPIEIRPDRARECPEGRHHASQVMYRDGDGDGRYARDRDTRVARRAAGCMVFHPQHDHWHFEAAARYTLFRADRPRNLQVARRKMSFCLRDSDRVPAHYDVTEHAERYGACSRRSPQGISIGWVDVYQSFLAGQAIRLSRRMRDGLYCLHLRVDPEDLLVETDDGDNTSMRAFVLRGSQVAYRDSRRCRGLAAAATGGG
jgi:hypothetical protein